MRANFSHSSTIGTGQTLPDKAQPDVNKPESNFILACIKESIRNQYIVCIYYHIIVLTMEDIRAKLKRLKEERRQASNVNFKAVLEENEASKKPANWEKTIERNERKIKEEEERQKAAEIGQDYELIKSLDIQAKDFERMERIKAAKRKEEPGYLDFEGATKRQYGRLVKQLSQTASPSKKSNSDSPLATKTTAVQVAGPSKEVLDSKEGIDRMVADVHQQIEVRSKRSRRRRFDEEADVDYINERNMKYNKKLERFYGGHTKEIKQNFERGTAI